MPTHIQAFPGVRRELYIRLDQVFLAALIIIEDPKLDLAIFGGRSEQPVLKWRPLKIKNAARVAFNKRKSRVKLPWLHRIKDCDCRDLLPVHSDHLAVDGDTIILIGVSCLSLSE